MRLHSLRLLLLLAFASLAACDGEEPGPTTEEDCGPGCGALSPEAGPAPAPPGPPGPPAAPPDGGADAGCTGFPAQCIRGCGDAVAFEDRICVGGTWQCPSGTVERCTDPCAGWQPVRCCRGGESVAPICHSSFVSPPECPDGFEEQSAAMPCPSVELDGGSSDADTPDAG